MSHVPSFGHMLLSSITSDCHTGAESAYTVFPELTRCGTARIGRIYPLAESAETTIMVQ